MNDEIFSKFDFPMKLDDITRFENKSLKNKEYPSISINVYSLDNDKKIFYLLRFRNIRTYGIRN